MFFKPYVGLLVTTLDANHTQGNALTQMHTGLKSSAGNYFILVHLQL